MDLLNLTREGLENEVNKAQVAGLIGEEKNEKIKRDMFSPSWLVKLSHYKPFSYEHYPGKLIWFGYNLWDSGWQFLKGLSWGKGFWEAIKEFFKQIGTPQKGY